VSGGGGVSVSVGEAFGEKPPSPVDDEGLSKNSTFLAPPQAPSASASATGAPQETRARDPWGEAGFMGDSSSRGTTLAVYGMRSPTTTRQPIAWRAQLAISA
jgi:hypothetical protein